MPFSYLDGVAYGDGIFVVVGSDVDFRLEGSYARGVILTSADGITWTERDSGTANSLLGVTCGDGTFVAVGEGGIILQSDLLN